MSDINQDLEIVSPKNQIQLFGYKYYFNTFIKLYQKNNLPNTILLSGPRGIGKATFAYHFINYLLSINEANKYSVNNFTINLNNKSYKSLCENIHPNFLLLDNDDTSEDIKIEKVRNTLKFLKKSTYSKDIKIVLIDNAEYLNIHSSSALLKSLEESNNKTFFFIIHNNSSKLLNTIKSRCIEFKFFISMLEKKRIIENIIKQYKDDFIIKKIDGNFYFDTPGNIMRYLLILNNNNIDSLKDKKSIILHLFDKYKLNNNQEILAFISFLIELFYNELSMKNNDNLNLYFVNKFKLLKQIDDMKKFNLDKKNLFVSLQKTLQNE